jgi:YD repeat-containing protein
VEWVACVTHLVGLIRRSGPYSTNGATDHYNIDPAGRLTGVSYADGTQVTFGYDTAGNRKSMTSGGSTTSYSHDAASQLTDAGSTT